jgi:hypothetical protein
MAEKLFDSIVVGSFQMKRVVILGLDALEYDLVEKFDLKNLKQTEYGKIALRDPKLVVTPRFGRVSSRVCLRKRIRCMDLWNGRMLFWRI